MNIVEICDVISNCIQLLYWIIMWRPANEGQFINALEQVLCCHAHLHDHGSNYKYVRMWIHKYVRMWVRCVYPKLTLCSMIIHLKASHVGYWYIMFIWICYLRFQIDNKSCKTLHNAFTRWSIFQICRGEYPIPMSQLVCVCVTRGRCWGVSM